ncbi:hypothetical protein MTR_6g075940 [Medicago truncatula]|uniref:Replication protein A 70 kDa DNA-binding subunit B/D first OB fold domain-containing protein n=1 Tax=Medicago truncatula TaxID=3880 RepID=G7KJR7_MEDTR|nr:hypothetical protein MTR_6g075940 [Medicago truncatula]
MSRDYDYIKDLKNDLEIWKIGFGVLDFWVVTGSNVNQHMKLIICDAKGDRVHVIYSLPPKEKAMKNTWVDNSSISAENV